MTELSRRDRERLRDAVKLLETAAALEDPRACRAVLQRAYRLIGDMTEVTADE
jgi:hypothetical protein